MVNLIQIPTDAVICHYKDSQVVTASGKVIAASFYDLRNTHEFYLAINGAGGWVVLVPRTSLFSQSQANPQLF